MHIAIIIVIWEHFKSKSELLKSYSVFIQQTINIMSLQVTVLLGYNKTTHFYN